MSKLTHTSTAIVSLLGVCLSCHAQESDPMLFFQSESLSARGHLQSGVNLVEERNLFWNFSDTVAPESGFEPDTGWREYYIKGGLSFERLQANGATFYGKATAVASYTGGTDAYDFDNIGSIDPEEAYLGFRNESQNGYSYDISAGRRELRLGTGMLIANGGSSGFERGAIKFGPRKSWDRTGLFRASRNRFQGTVFYLDPNERPAINQDNRLAGLDIRYDGRAGQYLGVTYISVLNSESPYVQAAPGGAGAPTILDGARDGTRALNFYAQADLGGRGLPNWVVATDIALERNSRNDLEAWAGRIQGSYRFANTPWAPMITYSYQTFSGDDPNTPELERFDPLYYEGSPSAWATGSKSSMVFINSNVQAHGIALRVQPTTRDTVTLRTAHIRVNELRSPIQFGQATRIETSGATTNVISGVTDEHLSDDIFLEYSRIINRNLFLTAGASVSLPGDGTKSIVDGEVPNWTGWFVNLVINY